MAINKDSILVGTHPTNGLDVHRRFIDFDGSRDKEIIKVVYDEFYVVNGEEIEVKKDKYYIVKDLKIGDGANDIIMEEDFNGFQNWYNFDVGQYPNGVTLSQIIVGAINATLQGIPIGAKSGYTITHLT